MQSANPPEGYLPWLVELDEREAPPDRLPPGGRTSLVWHYFAVVALLVALVVIAIVRSVPSHNAERPTAIQTMPAPSVPKRVEASPAQRKPDGETVAIRRAEASRKSASASAVRNRSTVEASSPVASSVAKARSVERKPERKLASAEPNATIQAIAPKQPRAERHESVSVARAGEQTIQLVSLPSAEPVRAMWEDRRKLHPQLVKLRHAVVPATVGSRKVFRLRVFGAKAHAICDDLRRKRVECLKIGH
jgi:hypothetical protein